MAGTTTSDGTVADETVAEVLAELAALEDPRTRQVNEKHGDDHGVNLGNSVRSPSGSRPSTSSPDSCGPPTTPRPGSSRS
ncbi:hypothetical protein [Pseudonocardia sp.]|uniref:hypothetical protein n=1 Tax=Pseudonocardia sp. TaxID=60912 RepID=UPI003435DA92